ncbi:MAG TPA: acyl-ACP desaturase, partial [Acidimicrobiia bacterium]|nr:acyl-ACP desaturase [Acidimicrobiia bacterium]
ADENHHFMFYRGVAKAMLDLAPEIMLDAMHRVLSTFQMPGTTIPGFVRRAVEIAKAGVYNLRIHHDRVLVPVIRDWGVEQMTGLSVKAQELQEKVLEIPAKVIRRAEIVERRLGIVST